MPALVSTQSSGAEGMFDVSAAVMVWAQSSSSLFDFSSKTMEHLLPTAPRFCLSCVAKAPPPTDTTPSGSTPPHPKPPQSTVYRIYTYDPCRGRGHRSGKRKCSSSLRLCCHHSGRFLTKPYICLQVYLFYLAIKCESSSSPVVVKPFDWLGHSGL